MNGLKNKFIASIEGLKPKETANIWVQIRVRIIRNTEDRLIKGTARSVRSRVIGRFGSLLDATELRQFHYNQLLSKRG